MSVQHLDKLTQSEWFKQANFLTVKQLKRQNEVFPVVLGTLIIFLSVFHYFFFS